MLVAALFTWGISNLVFMFFINKLHIKDLVRDGYQAKAQGRRTGAGFDVRGVSGTSIWRGSRRCLTLQPKECSASSFLLPAEHP